MYFPNRFLLLMDIQIIVTYLNNAYRCTCVNDRRADIANAKYGNVINSIHIPIVTVYSVSLVRIS